MLQWLKIRTEWMPTIFGPKNSGTLLEIAVEEHNCWKKEKKRKTVLQPDQSIFLKSFKKLCCILWVKEKELVINTYRSNTVHDEGDIMDELSSLAFGMETADAIGCPLPSVSFFLFCFTENILFWQQLKVYLFPISKHVSLISSYHMKKEIEPHLYWF